jgi:Flp pilus assembly protein TadG
MTLSERHARGLPHLSSRLKLRARFACRDRRGSVAIILSLSLLPLLAIAGGALEFATMSNLRSQLQAAADAGALRAAGELRLARMGGFDVSPFARTAAQNVLMRTVQPLSSVSVSAALIDNNSAVRVNVTGVYVPKLLRAVYSQPVTLSAQAVARTNGFPICALALEEKAGAAIYLKENARVTAQFCAVQSNSKSPQGLTGADNSVLTAGMICSAGGKVGKKTNFTPDPLTDCPTVADPLAARSPPSVGGCAHDDEIISGGTVTLMPGVFCGGLKVTNGATVTLSAGEYVIKDGPLVVDGGATFKSDGAGIYLTGANAVFKFATASSISLTAPTSGPLAGILFFEDRAAPLLQIHEILSDNASTLLGTIYLPRGQLNVNANKSIAQASAFTIIVASRMQLFGGPNLVLNSDFNSTSVPAPGGLNPGYSYLSQ